MVIQSVDATRKQTMGDTMYSCKLHRLINTPFMWNLHNIYPAVHIQWNGMIIIVIIYHVFYEENSL